MPAPRSSSRLPQSMSGSLAQQAPAKPVQNIMSVDKYYRSADLLLKQAQDYRQQHNEEQLYVMLLRFASLLIDTIPKHKDFHDKDATFTRMKKVLRDTYLPELERLKLSLDTRDIMQPRVFSMNRPADVVQLSLSSLPDVQWDKVALPPGASVGAHSPGPRGLQDGHSASHQAQQQQKAYSDLEIDDLLDIMGQGPTSSARPSTASSATAQPPYSRSSYDGRGAGQPAAVAAGEFTNGWDGAAAASSAATAFTAGGTVALRPPQYSSTYMASTSAMSERHALFAQAAPRGTMHNYSRSTPPSSSGRYPSVVDLTPQVQQMDLSNGTSSGQRPAQRPSPPSWDASHMAHPSAGPSLQPQEMQVHSIDGYDPFRPATCFDHAPPLHPSFSAPVPPVPPPPRVQSTLGGPQELVKTAQLRDVHISVALMDEFLAYANSNSARNIESCGILSGKLSANDSTFTITTLIIPQQKGTSDTVQAENEEDIFEAQFERELYPLGWIHTHPSQTCFLSSVDVHTQCGYQTMLEEAVAIVMAPTDATKKCGIFRLSTPGGLSLVQKCGQHGFHTHPDTSTGQDVYELCGHVFLNPRVQHEVLDLRKSL